MLALSNISHLELPTPSFNIGSFEYGPNDFDHNMFSLFNQDFNITQAMLLRYPKLNLIMELNKQCYTVNRTNSVIFYDGSNGTDEDCNQTFDGFACWDQTPANSIAYQRCPPHIMGFDKRRVAYKKCTDHGQWYVNPDLNRTWTNYSDCIDREDLSFRTTVNLIYLFGYSLSIITLLMSIFIFSYFRPLHCTRIRVHTHLFAAIAINNFLWILWYKNVIENTSVLSANKIWCRLLYMKMTYFMVSSYFWMFCEALHLHISLVVVFVREELAMRFFIFMGWIFPGILSGCYFWVRYTTESTERCWMDPTDSFSIIYIPVAITLGISLLILSNVIRILLSKIQRTRNHISVAAKKAARASIILIPLFGLHFMLIPLKPTPGTTKESIYEIFSALITSLQGLCVSVFFCFTNQDVIAAVKGWIARRKRRNEAIPMTGGVTEGAESLANTRENAV